MEQVAEIFILDHGKAPPFNDNERLVTAEDVLAYLPGLVTTLRKTNATEIRFAHFSIKEYLCSERIAQEWFSTPEQTSHLHIAESCLAYHLQLSESILATKDSLRQYALWNYVVPTWVVHLERVAPESWTTSVKDRATRVFLPRAQPLLNMVRIYNFDPDRRVNPGTDWEMTSDKLPVPLSYAASLAAFQLTSFLISNGADVNESSPSEHYGTALQAVAAKGHRGFVQLLLDNGANVNAQGGYHGSALQAAVAEKHQGIVQLLLDNGADVNAQGGHYGTALQAAAAAKHQGILQLLLENGAEVNAQAGLYGTALLAAAYRGSQEIVQLLLENSADVNISFESGKSIDDINTEAEYLGSALQAAASNARIGVMQLLLDNGADINARGGLLGNALQMTIAMCKLDAAELLLARGAKLDPPGAEWEELLGNVQYEPVVWQLRKCQEDVSGYIERMRQEQSEQRLQMEAQERLQMEEQERAWRAQELLPFPLGESSEDAEDDGS